MFSLVPSDVDLLDRGPLRAHATLRLGCAPALAFGAVTAPRVGPSSPLGMAEFRWVTQPGACVDAVRRVRFGAIAFEERVLAWQPPTDVEGGRFAFSVERSTVPLARSAAEDWRFLHDADGTLLQWTLVVELPVLLRPLWPLAARAIPRVFLRGARRLAAELATGALPPSQPSSP